MNMLVENLIHAFMTNIEKAFVFKIRCAPLFG